MRLLWFSEATSTRRSGLQARSVNNVRKEAAAMRASVTGGYGLPSGNAPAVTGATMPVTSLLV